MAVVGAEDVTPKVVGAALPSETVEFRPRLAGVGADTTVAIHNPLPDDFRFLHARSVIENSPLRPEAAVAQEKAGLAMGKDMGQSSNHYTQVWIIKSGETKNLPGDIAQKAVQDLITYMLGIQGDRGKAKIADGYQRKLIEDQIIVTVRDNMEVYNELDASTRSIQEVEKLNEPSVEPPDPPPGQGVSFESNSPSRKATPKA